MNEQDYFNQHFGMYSKIQDNLMYLGDSENLVGVSINLHLYNKRSDRIDYYYKEIQYISNKLGVETRKIKRDYEVYLSMENLRPIGTYREFIVIKAKDIEFFRMNLLPKLEELIMRFDEIYTKRDSKIYVTDAFKPFEIGAGNKTLLFSAGLGKSGDEVYPIIEMYLNSNKQNLVSVSFDQLYGFMYIIRTIDLYNYAASMLAYLQRPPSTTNLVDITSSQDRTVAEPIPVEDPSKRHFVGDPPRQAHKISYFNNK